MGWGERLPSGKWRAVWRDEQGRKRSRSGIRTEAAAKRYASEQEGRSRRGDPTADGRCPKWSDWLTDWRAIRRVEPSTAAMEQTIVARHIEPRWGEIRLNRITRSQVQAWVNELERTPIAAGDEPRCLSAGSVRRIYNLFASSMSEAAVSEDVPLAVTPCRKIELPTVGGGVERFLTRGEFDLIAHHLNEPYRTAASILVGTGMRFGEFAGLHWHRVDLETARVHVVEAWDPDAAEMKPYPKGGRARWVPFPTWLRPILEAQIDRQGDPKQSCGLRHRGTAACRSGLVVTGEQGRPLYGRNFGRRQWADAVKLAGVDHVRLHDLRHTCFSWLVQAGVPLQEVQRIAGHASIVTTQRYSHLGDTQDELVRAALG